MAYFNSRGLLVLIIAAAAFSTLPIFMKVAFEAGVNLTTLLAYRFLFSAMFCFASLLMTGKSLALPLEMCWPVFFLGGIVHVAVSFCYALSVRDLPASLTGLIFYLYPAMVALLAALTGQERLDRLKVIALVVCFAGLLQVLGVSFGAASLSGMLFGVGAAFLQACHVLVSNRLLASLSPLLIVGWSAFATSSVFFLYGLVTGELLHDFSAAGWGSVFGTGFFANYIGIVCFFFGMQQVGPSIASVVMNLEPVLTIVLSVIVLGESFGWGQAVGGAIILTGLYFLQRGRAWS